MEERENFSGFSEHKYIPILRSQSLQLLKEVGEKQEPKQILEIGTFIGYSACVMLDSCKESFVTTLEIDEKNAKDANINLESNGFSGRFKVINCDAFDFLQQNQDKRYDLIFLDGPKGQYFKYLPYLKKMLNENGVLFADDVLFHGLVKKEGPIIHKHRTIVTNLRKYIEAVSNDEDFETTLYDFEDGVCLSVKKR